jgi:hypothetical protein
MLARLKRLAKFEELSLGYYVRRGLALYIETRLKASDVTPEVKAILMPVGDRSKA